MRPRKVINADSNEFGNRIARSKCCSRIPRAIRDQSDTFEGRGSLHTLSMNGAAVKSPATQGRTNNVILASGKEARTVFIAGIANTESPTQFGPRIKMFLICITNDSAVAAQDAANPRNPQYLRIHGVQRTRRDLLTLQRLSRW